MIILILLGFVDVVKTEMPIGYTVFRGISDSYIKDTTNNNEKHLEKCPIYYTPTCASIINYEEPKCVNKREFREMPNFQDVLLPGTIDVFTWNSKFLYYQNRTRYTCSKENDLKLEKIEIFDYNRWIPFPLKYMRVERNTIYVNFQSFEVTVKNYDTTGELFRLYINCGGQRNSFYKKYKGYHYYIYPFLSIDAHQNNVTRHQDGDIFAKGASVNKCGDFNAQFYATTECKCKENGTLLYDRYAQRCFVDEEIEHNFQKETLLRLPENSESKQNHSTEPHESVIWYNRTSDVLTANFVDVNREIPVCSSVESVTCQMYGNRQMTKCPIHEQIVQLRNSSVYFVLSKKDFKTFTGQVALFTFECYQGNKKTTQQYKFLMKFDGSSQNLHTEQTKTTKKYDHTWWIVCAVVFLICLTGIFGIKQYLKKLKENKKAWADMELMIQRTVTPKDTGGIYMQVFDRTNEPIYQKIPQHPSETVSPFPRAGPLAYENFLNRDM